MASVQTTETQLGATMMTVMECSVLGTRVMCGVVGLVSQEGTTFAAEFDGT